MNRLLGAGLRPEALADDGGMVEEATLHVPVQREAVEDASKHRAPSHASREGAKVGQKGVHGAR
eukprot:CAMPEP_0175252504 /NCGR_PEP_ID=MMETSP0093-20121207/36206_1 /TAXON_ID=311494 /ORGANISM="Alexandrium monilatum, Strain CCMP3105" /LENGTH=63 /DNA_ID=CAMNT_0016546789 /DNA_START=392 /DNA_END=580 /DNA_ORIENTATION=-